MIIATIATVFSFSACQNKERQPTGTADSNVSAVARPDIKAGSNRATLTLADGKTIVLDSAATGEVGQQGYARMQKTADEQLVYVTDRPGANMTEHSSLTNTLRTPKGGQYQLVLSDGSRVFLNAASSITFPSVFVGPQRRVEITGEVYFEVSRKPARPFHVMARDVDIQVLGTRFNVNAYGDEARVRTTLLQGTILIKNGIALEQLAAGQQGEVDRQGSLEVKKVVDTAAALSWRNGFFSFNGQSLSTSLRQISRWYDINISIDPASMNRSLTGRIDRSLSLNQVISRLDTLGFHAELRDHRQLFVR